MAVVRGYVARIKAVRCGGLVRKQEGDRAGRAGEAGGRRERGGFARLLRSGAALARRSGKGESRAGTGGVRRREEGEK